jgi:acetolactate synthase-1/2/3 large subunit
MFGNPLPYHFVQRAEGLPTLTIVCNNAMWFAVRQSTVDVYPKGKAVESNEMPLVHLSPSPDYEKTIHTCGGYGEKVEDPAELMGAIERGLAAVRSGTSALLNVITQGR